MLEGIVGHKRQIDMLARAIAKDRVPHAYIFAGPEGVGKKLVGIWLAKVLIDPPSFENYFHPDFLLIEDEAGIKIEKIRELIYKLSLKPYSAEYKVALIDRAETMTLEASNALLKALEEPKPNTVIILVTSSVERLPKTIISRTQKINFGLVGEDELKVLVPATLSADQKDLISSVAAGRPGWVKKVLADPENFTELESWGLSYQTFNQAERIDRLLLAQEIAGQETTEIKTLLDFWLVRLERDLNLTGKPELANKLRLVSRARRFIEQNLNAKLVLSELILAT
ncbi:MAG: DNA polymerase III subunit [Candidatus Doudnabacteria bacterium]|nr:DNA polymerase III subunit [Candidatus Doudnabacteria bacterium]